MSWNTHEHVYIIWEATYMRQIVMDQKLIEQPQPITATVQTESPTPISRNGFTLQNFIKYKN